MFVDMQQQQEIERLQQRVVAAEHAKEGAENQCTHALKQASRRRECSINIIQEYSMLRNPKIPAISTISRKTDTEAEFLLVRVDPDQSSPRRRNQPRRWL